MNATTVSRVPKLDADRCRRRNLAAAMAGFNAAPFRLGAVGPPPPPDGARVVTASGKLPADDAEALAMINARLGPGEQLTPERVWLHYPEAANRNYIAKYQMFLGLSTLKNIAAAGADGISVMNSHRTGGMSTPTELPYGRTFAARLETLEAAAGARDHRVLLGFYMARGVRPNGEQGPSTDELNASIQAGTLNEVSLGFSTAGTAVCDVCGRDMEELDEDRRDYLCPHAPGTHRGMSAEQVAAQKARGVPGGVCTFTLEGADVNELSAVYSGALPGAGFRKTARLARSRRLDAGSMAEASAAYAVLTAATPAAGLFAPPRPQGRSDPSPRLPAVLTLSSALDPRRPPMQTPTLADAFAFWEASGRPNLPLSDLLTLCGGGGGGPAPTDPAPAPAASDPAAPAPAARTAPMLAGDPFEAQLAAMREEMARQRQEFEAARANDRAAAVALAADRYVAEKIRAGQMTAAERATFVGLYRTAAEDDARSPVKLAFNDPKDNQPRVGGRLDVLLASVERRPVADTGNPVTVGDPGQQQGAGDPTVTLAAQTPRVDELQAIYDLAHKYGERVNGRTSRGLAGAR